MNKVKGKKSLSNLETESDESNHREPNLDLSLMRQPIATSICGFEEVLRAYEAGTNELRKLLSRECDLIYECKVCRNIFRSLTNFISHKRVYCRSSFNSADHFHFRDNGFQVQDISTIIQAEQEINNNPNGSANVPPGTDDKSKDLSGIVERLLWKQHQSRTSNLSDFYDQIQTSKKGHHDDSTSTQKSHTLKLNRVNDSDVAVYQSLQVDNENSNMKDEINEVHKMLQKSNTVLGPDGKVLNLFNSGSSAPKEEFSNVPLTCQICKLSFETEKTLKLHLELKHLPSTYFYQCPSCPQKFSSSAAVIKHLSNDHKKNNRRIRMMRDNIIRKRVRADEVVNKTQGVNRELQKLQQSGGSEQPSEENADWHTNDLSGDYQNDSYTCPSCFKKFDRKAVYASHVQACSDAKCREKDKLKKRKAKEETKSKQLLEFEENSNGSAQSSHETPAPTVASTETSPEAEATGKSKRKRKQTNKVKKGEAEVKLVSLQEESSSVDWNLDDEEEKRKLEVIKAQLEQEKVLEYKRTHPSVASSSAADEVTIKLEESMTPDDDDDDENALVIDEKTEENSSSSFSCPQCDKVFDTEEKRKYHLNTYHSRQKRFKCKKCEYQGYRKKDTINHLNYVHNINGEKESLESYMESVMKAVDEESLAKQNELKKNQLKIKRKMAREKLKQNGTKDEVAAVEAESSEPPASIHPEIKIEVKQEFKEPAAVSQAAEPTSDVKPPKIRRKSLHTSILIPPETDSVDDLMKIPKMFIKAKVESGDDEKKKRSHKRRESGTTTGSSSLSPQAGQSLLNISRFGKIVKRSSNGDSKQGETSRPIRNRIKPVRKDFLYDLSDLLKKDADAYREQAVQSNAVGYKRELRKRAMSTNTRELPNFEDQALTISPERFAQPSAVPSSKDEDDIPLVKFKDHKSRRMSVFLPPTRPMFPTPRSPIYRPPPEPSSAHPNAGAANKMALREFNANRASLYEPKFLWSICFDQEEKDSSPLASQIASSITPKASTAASILQKLTGKISEPSKGFLSSITTCKSVDDESSSSASAEQLCTSFDMINVTSVSENELDIPDSRAINLNPGKNGLVALALGEAGSDVCVLQECGPDSDDDDDDDEEDEKASSSSAVSDIEPPKKSRQVKRGERRVRRSKKSSEKRKSSANGQRRLTVMQRLQENKIRKSREQLFKRLIMDRQNDDENPSPVYNLFSES